LGIGTYNNVATVSKDTPLIEVKNAQTSDIYGLINKLQVLDLLAERDISAVPIVGDNGIRRHFLSYLLNHFSDPCW